MDEATARAIHGWFYESPYDVYDLAAEPVEDLVQAFLDPQNAYYAIHDEEGDLVGYCCFGPDARVPGGGYGRDAVDVGLGLRPDLTGQGRGAGYVRAVLDFARLRLSPAGGGADLPTFRVTVAEFNRRAQRVWEKVGFRRVQRFRRTTDGMPFVVLVRPWRTEEEPVEQPIRRRIAVVTDSTADVPQDLVAEYGIVVVPQILIMGNETWLDGVDIDPATFYELLRTSPHFPSSSQASVQEFHDRFVELAEDHDGIVAVLVSGELSGTINSAVMAAGMLSEIPIEIVDSQAASMQLGLMALAAARVAAGGGDLQAVAAAARQLVGRAHVYFVVDTLEYLHRGGRIGGAARLFGTALNLKPVLCVQDGVVHPVAKVRSRRKALERVYGLVEKDLVGKGPVHMAVLHVAAPEEAARLAGELEQRFRPAEMIQSECGPVIGTHVGPGTVGVAFYAETE